MEIAGQTGGRLYVGAWPDDGAFAEGAPLVFAQPRRCLLVCAPSQAGKTSSLAIPQLLAAPGPAVVGDYDRLVHSQTLADTGRWGAKTESLTTSTQRHPSCRPHRSPPAPAPAAATGGTTPTSPTGKAKVAALIATPWYACAPWPQVITSALGAYHGEGLPCPQLSADAFADTPERYQTYLDAAATLGTDHHPPPPGPPQLPPPGLPAPPH